MPPALGARSLNHWTTREVPISDFKVSQVTGMCGPGRQSVGQRVTGWGKEFGDGQEDLCEKVAFKQGTRRKRWAGTSHKKG